jgi:hypothetical protein
MLVALFQSFRKLVLGVGLPVLFLLLIDGLYKLVLSLQQHFSEGTFLHYHTCPFLSDILNFSKFFPK